MEKPLSGLMYCKRGPKLLIEAAPNITALSNVSPVAPRRQMLIPKKIVYPKKYIHIERNDLSGICCPLKSTGSILDGCDNRFMSVPKCLNSNKILIIFKPPAVDRAEPPIKEREIRIATGIYSKPSIA